MLRNLEYVTAQGKTIGFFAFFDVSGYVIQASVYGIPVFRCESLEKKIVSNLTENGL